MNSTVKKTLIKQHRIRIGSDELVESKVSCLFGAEPDSDEAIEKAYKALETLLKEMRVRVGTLLKTDNVSFLFGAGASMDAGGVSLASIPLPLERELIIKATMKEAGVYQLWLRLFYETVTLLTKKQVVLENRIDELSDLKVQPIAINLEDYISHLHTWLAAIGDAASVEIKTTSGNKYCFEKQSLSDLIKNVTGTLSSLLDLPKTGKEDKLSIHRKFVKKVLTRPLNLRRANIFTLNYDTMIEQGADAEGAVLVDGFVGTLKRVFRPESYDLDFYFPAQTTEGRVHRFDRALHLYKLHGSINWHRTQQNWENPYGLYASFYNQNCDEDDVLIYPSPLKYGQALGLPYSELFRRLGNAIAQPQSVMFTVGYGFGDDHVNALIRQALAIPSFTLIVIDPNPTSAFVQELIAISDERVWFVSGCELGTFEKFVGKLLPDLREEEIDSKVMRTFKALMSNESRDVSIEGESNVE